MITKGVLGLNSLGYLTRKFRSVDPKGLNWNALFLAKYTTLLDLNTGKKGTIQAFKRSILIFETNFLDSKGNA
jgi:hypothetical protein